MTERYEKISMQATRRWLDESGKPRQQTKTFWQTLNPFNIDATGAVKSTEQIYAELRAEADAWIADAKSAAARSA